jgi:valyl-tRNA synthetase
MKPLAKKAIKSLEKNKIKFFPSTKLKQSIEYLKNIRDWNISRQIAWGIPIPAFHNREDPNDWIYNEEVDKDEIIHNGKVYVRDTDVFDTWFSSGQWPYIVLDYPDSKSYKKFFPLTLMETGGEILYQWVCRMIMLSLYTTGKIPFKSVYIHGLVLAADGSKMSKSTGNVIDPMPLIEKYGSDAVRIGIISGRAAAVNRGFDVRRVEEARNFANKLWNIYRFIESKIADVDSPSKALNQRNIQDEWILERVNNAIRKVSDFLDEYRYTEAFETLYHLVWDDFADWYIESSKNELNYQVITHCLDSILVLTHPFAPFLTEVIWQNRSWNQGDLLVNGKWPKLEKTNLSHVNSFNKITKLVEEIRFIRANTKNAVTTDILHTNSDLNDFEKLIKSLAKISSISFTKDVRGLKLNSYKNVWLEMTDEQLRELKLSLNRQIMDLEQRKEIIKKRLANKSYLKNAPKELVNESKNDLLSLESTINSLKEQTSKFE